MKNKLPDDPHRKARFREEARGIVAADRNNRKYGLAVDTAGSIARALERAYKDGFDHGQSGAPIPTTTKDDILNGDDPLDWLLIPPQPRRAFWSIYLFGLGRDLNRKAINYDAARLLLATSARGNPAWRIEGKQHPGNEFGDRTIVPLVRLGLLDFNGKSREELILTERGVSTWRKFVEAAGDFP